MRPTRKGPGKKMKEQRLRREDSPLWMMGRNGGTAAGPDNETLCRAGQAGRSHLLLRPTAAPDTSGQSRGEAKILHSNELI
ncbi:hypothetical protein MTO96_010186 [Rhipicephalus appendiculatus]